MVLRMDDIHTGLHSLRIEIDALMGEIMTVGN
jgi:hypothetical protein